MAREQRLVFGEVADVYDRARPAYPESLVDAVIASARLVAGDPVLESGCGTGKATVPFARRALTMTALEPDPAMASIAQRNCAGLDVSVEITSFEDWAAPPGPGFKLVMAAQSWHWVQPAVRLPEGARGARRRRCRSRCSGTVPTGPRPRCATRSTPRTNGSCRSSARGCRASRGRTSVVVRASTSSIDVRPLR